MACLAAYYGQTDCLRVFKQFQLRFTGSICLHAADTGDLLCLRLAHQLGDYVDMHTAMQAVVQGRSQFSVRKFFLSTHVLVLPANCSQAGGFGSHNNHHSPMARTQRYAEQCFELYRLLYKGVIVLNTTLTQTGEEAPSPLIGTDSPIYRHSLPGGPICIVLPSLQPLCKASQRLCSAMSIAECTKLKCKDRAASGSGTALLWAYLLVL